MDIDKMFPSKFLRCDDLNGKPMRVTIAGLKQTDLGGEQKYIMEFTSGEKSLVLNKTNTRAIGNALGKETRNWIGKDIILVPAQVDFRGDTVDAIRVRAASSKAMTATPTEEVPFNDDIVV